MKLKWALSRTWVLKDVWHWPRGLGHPCNPMLSTSPGMRQGNDHGSQYRSAIYPTSAEHMGAALRSKEDYQKVGPISLPGHLWGKSLVLGTWPCVPFACFGKFLSASWNRGLLPCRMEMEMASMCSYACLLKSDYPDEYTTWHQISLSLWVSISLWVSLSFFLLSVLICLGCHDKALQMGYLNSRNPWSHGSAESQGVESHSVGRTESAQGLSPGLVAGCLLPVFSSSALCAPVSGSKLIPFVTTPVMLGQGLS